MNIHHLFDLNEQSSRELYFQMKNKYGYSFNDDERLKFENLVLDHFKSLNIDFDSVIYAQTDNHILKSILSKLNKNQYEMKKNSATDIKLIVDGMKMSKPEKQKLMTSLSSNDIVKIASLAGNQRRRIQPHLFKSEQVNVGTKVLFFDDSMFSGSTLNAVKQQYPIHEVFVIFKK